MIYAIARNATPICLRTISVSSDPTSSVKFSHQRLPFLASFSESSTLHCLAPDAKAGRARQAQLKVPLTDVRSWRKAVIQ